MMWSMVKMVIDFIVSVASWLIGAVIIALIPFAVVCLIRYIYYYRKGYRIPQRKHLSTYHKHSFLRRLFWDFPDRFVKDRLIRNPDAFPYNGLIMICGEQGSGKSMCSVHMLLALKKMYPKLHISSNIRLTFQDSIIESPDDIILRNNGESGCIKFLDEIQNWFNSNESANFPPEMLSEVSQQRKQYSLFVGTSQKFNRIGKAIREQTSYLLLPLTIAGCMTIVRVYKPTLDTNGEMIKKRAVKTYFFVHSEEIREAYDTYEKVKRLSMKGWKPRSEQITTDNVEAPALAVALPVDDYKHKPLKMARK